MSHACLVDRRMHCKRGCADVGQVKRHIVIGFGCGVLAGAFEDAFGQVFACGKHSGTLVHELRVTLPSNFKTSGRGRTISRAKQNRKNVIK